SPAVFARPALPHRAPPPEPLPLALPDALPISRADRQAGPHAHSSIVSPGGGWLVVADLGTDELRAYPLQDGPQLIGAQIGDDERSEEHTSELQSRENLVCRLLPEKKTARAWCP